MTERKRYLFLMFALAAGLSIVGCGGGSSNSILPPPVPADFTISVTPASVTVTQGGASSPVSISISPLHNFSGNVSVAISGLPAGVTSSAGGAFQIAAGASQSVTFSAANTATLGPVNLSFQGTSGSLSHSAGAAITVNAAGDFALSVAPGQFSVTQGSSSAPVSIGVTALNSFSGQVTLNIAGLPAGVTTSPALPIQFSAGAKQQITFSAALSVSPGTANPVFQAVSGSLSHSANASLQIQAAQLADFALALDNSSVALKPGGSQAVHLTVDSINGFGANVSLNISGLPAGVTASLAANPVAAGSTTGITFTAAKNAAAGRAVVSLSGADGSLSHTLTASVQVVANAATTAPTVSVTYVDAGVGGTFEDSFIRIVNTGLLSTSSMRGDECANIYVFDHFQELRECCSCPVTANGTIRLDLGNLITNATPSDLAVASVSIDVVPSAFTSSTPCDPTTYTAIPNGLDVWGTHSAGVSRAVETPALTTPLSTAELSEMQSICNDIVINDSSAGICTCPGD